jgi:hypoxia-inducible factor (prolyl hydroxylase)
MYPGEGARFARHIDNTTADGRRLTVLAYLNPAWEPEQGGALRLFTKNKEDGSMNAIDVFPLAGRVAMFYSADIQHEVRPTFGMRHSITIWYYDKQERISAVEASKEDGTLQAAAESSLENQMAAKEFIR